MKSNIKVEIIDITKKNEYERYLYRCLAPMPFRKYRRRQEYLGTAIPRGFHKKLLIFDGEVVGQIEYAPVEASGYPIMGENVIVMHCIWVLRRAKGHNFGKQLLADIMESERKADGFATLGLGNHWSPWLKIGQMEKLGFKSLDSIEVKHKTKHKRECFKIHLMWQSTSDKSRLPTWNKSKLLEGVDFCLAHPLYHPEKPLLREILENVDS